jgi:uncharacterized spore protein YtfJ
MGYPHPLTRGARAGNLCSMTNLIESVTQTIQTLGVKAAYGEPVTVGGVEIVPVALVNSGFGAGSDDEDGGGGGGGASIPIGAYVGGETGPRFEPNPIALLTVLIPLTWVAGKALTHIVKALKK